MGYLEFHQQMQHGKTAGGRQHLVTTAPGGEPQIYKMDFPTGGGRRTVPLRGIEDGQRPE